MKKIIFIKTYYNLDTGVKVPVSTCGTVIDEEENQVLLPTGQVIKPVPARFYVESV